MSSGSLKSGHIVETRCSIRTPGLFMFSKGPYLVGPQKNQAPLLAILYISENLRPFQRCTNGGSCRQMTLFQRNSIVEKYNLRLRGGRSSVRTLRTVSVFETALLGRAAENLGLTIGYSPPLGKSQALREKHKWPFMPPNGAIAGQQCGRERYSTTGWRRGGIRSLTGTILFALYRFHVAVNAKNILNADSHCTKLHQVAKSGGENVGFSADPLLRRAFGGFDARLVAMPLRIKVRHQVLERRNSHLVMTYPSMPPSPTFPIAPPLFQKTA